MGQDYPRSLEELETQFATEAACLAYLAALRWPASFVCPAPAGAHPGVEHEPGLKATRPAATDDDLNAWDYHNM